jgi:hypothetical protein
MVEQILQIDVAIKVSGPVAKLHHDTAQLYFLGLGDIWHEADDAGCLSFRFSERGRLVQCRLTEQLHSALIKIFHAVAFPYVC